MKKMYDRSGKMYFVRREFDDDTLLVADAEIKYYSGGPDSYEEVVPGDTLRILHKSVLHDSPPTQVIHEEIAKLSAQREEISNTKRQLVREVGALRKEIEQLSAKREELLDKSGLSQLDLFINGGISHYVEVCRSSYNTPRIVAFQDTKSEYSDREYGLKKARLLSLYGSATGDLSWELNRYRDGSGSNIEVIPCTSLEQAKGVLQEQFDIYMSKYVSEDALKRAESAKVNITDAYRAAVQEETVKYRTKELKEAQNKLDEAAARLAEAQSQLDQVQQNAQ